MEPSVRYRHTERRLSLPFPPVDVSGGGVRGTHWCGHAGVEGGLASVIDAEVALGCASTTSGPTDRNLALNLSLLHVLNKSEPNVHEYMIRGLHFELPVLAFFFLSHDSSSGPALKLNRP